MKKNAKKMSKKDKIIKGIKQRAASSSSLDVSKPSSPATSQPAGSLISTGLSHYKSTTPTLLRAIDIYLVFIMMTGVIQFVYMLLVGMILNICFDLRDVPI
jgi:hypothetical protein